MGFSLPELDEFPTTGTISLGGLNLTWDFTELVEERKRQERNETGFLLRNGRYIIPSLNIY